MSIEVIPSGGQLGAEVRGLHIGQPMSEATQSLLNSAWHQHLVLLFRDQVLDDEKQIAFTQHFGALEKAPRSEITAEFGEFDDVSPYVTVVSNIEKNGIAIGTLGSGEAYWHTDSSFNEQPIMGNFLYCLEAPPTGGETSFANMYRALATLNDRLRSRVEDRVINHCSAYTSGGQLKKGFVEVTDVTQAPGARHPIVRVHPATERPALYLGRRPQSWIVGLPIDESDALLDELWAHATRTENTWQHSWRPGDLLMWDNACTMHRRAAFDPQHRRLMHGTRTQGARPR